MPKEHKMFASSNSYWTMLAILESRNEDSSCYQDNTVHHLAIMLVKMWLNAVILRFWSRSMKRSLLGIGGISLCLADFLLLCAMVGTWLLRPHFSTSISLCFIMSHASTVYSVLPLPFLLLGMLDYARNLSPSTNHMGPCRTLSCCTMVLSVWALAGLYSYYYTNSQVIQVRKNETMLLCTVQNSCTITSFSILLSLAILCVLLFYCQKQLQRFCATVALSSRRDGPLPTSQCDLLLSYTELHSHSEAKLVGWLHTPLLLHLTQRFSSTWAPLLVLNVGCAFLNMPIPSQLTVNLLWLLCANSLLIGATLWFKGGQWGPYGDIPDDTCVWSLYGNQVNGGMESIFQEKLSHGIYTLI